MRLSCNFVNCTRVSLIRSRNPNPEGLSNLCRDAVTTGLTKSRPHDRTVRRPRLHAVNRPSCAVVLHDRKQSTGVQSSGPRTRTQVLPCQGRLVLVNTRRPCPCLLDRGTTTVSRRLQSVVPCSTRNEYIQE